MAKRISDSKLLTIPEVAEILDVSVETVRRRIKAGELRVFRDRRVMRIDPEDLEAYIATQRIR